MNKRSTWRFQCAILCSLLLFALSRADPAPEICGAANFDVRNLTTKVWRFEAPTNSCLTPASSPSPVDTCEITMGFCQSVNVSVPCAHAAVCESFGAVNDTYNLASYEVFSNPFNTAPLISGVGFTTQYKNGGTYVKPDKTSCTLSTSMTFRCNTSAVWNTDKAGPIMTVPVTPAVQMIYRDGLCIYNFTFDFAGACPVVIPSEQVNQLSAGSILLLIFFMSALLYLFLGGFINALRGHTGLSLLPHHEFWTALPGYIKDGIQFTITCGGRISGRQSYESI